LSNKQIKIRDVAMAAGVSESTVSRVLSGNKRISEKTRQKVMKIVDEMGYRPNAIATSLARNRSNSIGIVIPDSDNEFYSTTFFQEALRGISTVVSDNGYDVLISSGRPDEVTALKELVARRKVDGVILMRSHIKDQSIRFLHESKFPFVLIGTSVEYDDVYSVDNDNFGAAFELTKHILGQNRRNIAFIGGGSNFVYTMERLRGYEKCIESNGAELRKEYVRLDIDTVRKAYEAMSELLQLKRRPDAVIITDDTVCAGIMDSIRQNKLNIPDDIAVASFNDSLYNRLSIPPITSISVNSIELGRKAAETICRILSGDSVDIKKIRVDFRLLARDSTILNRLP
jgi:DNA-binding LacI/PurR family transcriptional regulator